MKYAFNNKYRCAPCKDTGIVQGTGILIIPCPYCADLVK